MLLTDLYVRFLAKNRRIKSASGATHYRIMLGHLSEALGHEPTLDDLRDVSVIALERHLSDRSCYTIHAYIGRLKSLWRFACRQGLVSCWPEPERFDLPAPDKPTWTVDQVRQLFAAADQLTGYYDGVPRAAWWRSFLLVLWDTGERAGATRACRWEWLDSDRLVIPARVRKGWKSAVYQLQPDTLASLEGIRGDRSLIWPWTLSDASYYLHFGKLLRAAGLPSDRKSKTQRVRRTHLTLWEAAGRDACSRAQHTSRAVTERFYLDASRLPVADPGTVLPPL